MLVGCWVEAGHLPAGGFELQGMGVGSSRIENLEI